MLLEMNNINYIQNLTHRVNRIIRGINKTVNQSQCTVQILLQSNNWQIN